MSVKSAERVLRIFELLSDYPHGLTAKEISGLLGYAGSSAFELLKTLKNNDYLLDDENKKYTLGPKLIQLGAQASNYLDINKIAKPYLQKVMEKLEETVFMAVLSEEQIVYVAKIDSYKTISTNANIGSRKPIYCTGLGKTFLSFLSAEERNKIIDQITIQQMTPNTVKSKEELLEQIHSYQQQGYAIDNEEIEIGLWCLAVPVYDANKKIIAAVSVSGPTARMLPKKELIIETMLDVSKQISAKLGCIYE